MELSSSLSGATQLRKPFDTNLTERNHLRIKHFSDVPAFQAGELGAVPGIRSIRQYTLWLRTSRKVNGYMEVRPLSAGRCN